MRPFLLKNSDFCIFKKWILFITASTKLKWILMPCKWYCCQQLSYKREKLAQITWCWHFKPPSVTSLWLSEVLWWDLDRLLVSTTHLLGYLLGIDRKKQECDGNTWPRRPLLYWSPLTLATLAWWTTRSDHHLKCFAFLILFPQLTYIYGLYWILMMWTSFQWREGSFNKR